LLFIIIYFIIRNVMIYILKSREDFYKVESQKKNN